MDGSEQVVVESGKNEVTIAFERTLYPLDVIYGASYIFIDRCFVMLDAPDDKRLSVVLRGREELDEQQLRDLAGEFGNEVLTQLWRQETVRQNQSIIEVVTARALAGTMDPGLGDDSLTGSSGPRDDLAQAPDLEEDLDDDLGDAFDDPLGIAVPWEEKYGKKDAEGDTRKPESSSDEDEQAKQGKTA